MPKPISAKIAITALELAKKISPETYERLLNAYIKRNPADKPKIAYAYAIVEAVDLGRNEKLIGAKTLNSAFDSVLYTTHFVNGGEHVFNAPVVEKLGAAGYLDDIVTRLSEEYSPQSSTLIMSIAVHGGLKHLSTDVLNRTLEKIVTEENMSELFAFENRLCLAVLTSKEALERISRENINNILLIASKVGDKYGHEILKAARDSGAFSKLDPEVAEEVIKNVSSQVADDSQTVEGQQNMFTQIDPNLSPSQIAERVNVAVSVLPDKGMDLFS